jgi:hypothetical protein
MMQESNPEYGSSTNGSGGIAEMVRRHEVKSMRALLVVIISLLVACTNLSKITTDAEDPEIVFGLMKECEPGRYCVYSETNSIPLVLGDPEFRFGVSIEHRRAGDHVGHIVLHSPAEPGQLAATFGMEHEPLDYSLRHSRKTMQTAEVPYSKYWGVDFSHDEGDAIGHYMLEVYVDGEMKRSIGFEVIPAGE